MRDSRIDVHGRTAFFIVKGNCVGVATWTRVCFVKMDFVVAVFVEQLCSKSACIACKMTYTHPCRCKTRYTRTHDCDFHGLREERGG